MFDGAVIVQLFPLLSLKHFLKVYSCHIPNSGILSCWRHNHNHWKRKAINNNQVLPSCAGGRFQKTGPDIKPVWSTLHQTQKAWWDFALGSLPFYNIKHSKIVGWLDYCIWYLSSMWHKTVLGTSRLYSFSPTTASTLIQHNAKVVLKGSLWHIVTIK